ncbi:MAG: hypothetical protein H7315_14345 [Herminiimonas sp.]|nr:hypothetical protein [Herminiimonas sp.]
MTMKMKMTSTMFKHLLCALLLFSCSAAFAQEGQIRLPADTWQQLKTLTGIKSSGKPEDLVQLIVLFDANCPHCASLWSQIYGKESRHRNLITLWAPVAYMGKDSPGKAVSLLRENSVQALATNFDNFDFGRRSGGAPVAEVTAAMRLSLERNSNTWRKLTAATPLLIYKTADGQVMAQVGLPPNARLDTLLHNLQGARLSNFGQ